MTRVALIHYCEAEGNVKQILQGCTDAPITENERHQLELLALRLRNIKIDVLYSSPLIRAYKIAVVINQYRNLPILQEQGLIELDGDEWEGILWTDLPEKFPEMAEIRWTAPYEFVSGQEESVWQIYDRIWETAMRLVQENPGKAIAVTSHGCAIHSFLCCAAGWLIEQLNDVDWDDNTAVSVTDFDKEWNAIIRLKNNASHLTGKPTCAAPCGWTRKN